MSNTNGVIASPQKGVFYGPPKVGKSTLAAACPKPIFIDLDNGTKWLNVARTETPQDFDSLVSLVKRLKDDPAYQTIVIDTMDAAERLALVKVCEGRDDICDFGWGKGYKALSTEIINLLSVCESAAKVKNVILLSHAQVVKFKTPGSLEGFDRWEMKLEKRISALVKEWADSIFFLNFVHMAVSEDPKNLKNKNRVGIGGRERMIYTTYCDAYDAGSRVNNPSLAEELPCEYDSIARAFPALTQTAKEELKKVAAPKVDVPTPKPEVSATPKAEPTVAAEDPLAWFANYEDAINVKLLAKSWITAGQTWRDLNGSRQAQLKGTTKAKMANWCGFELKEGDK